MPTTDFDIAIIGAGPAGCATTLALHDSGLSVALIDKATFPRDKICGDALSPDLVNQLHKLPVDTGPLFERMEPRIQCKSVRFFSPDFSHADLRLGDNHTSGYVSARLDFDAFMFNQAQKAKDVKTFTGTEVTGLRRETNAVSVHLDNGNVFSAAMVVGCDGAHSIVARQFLNRKPDPGHHCAGLRIYYENVQGFSEENAVELHFYKELLPGYFWMFPLPGNKANIGLGMLSGHIAKKRVNIKEMLRSIIREHPNVAPRFRDAKPLEDIKGFGLPLGSKKRPMSGANFLLSGDAASLINPLSGEGIANSVRSGRIAARHLKQAFEKNTFSATFNKQYDRMVYQSLWEELRVNYWLQLAMRKPWLCNLIVKKGLNNPAMQKLMMSGFDIEKIKSQFLSPGFYMSVLSNPVRDR